MDKYIYAAIDAETSGLTDGVHDILEIGIVQYDNKTLLPTGTKFVSYIKPINPKIFDIKALETNKLDLNYLVKNAPTPAQVRRAFLEWKYELFGDTKILPLGHNYDSFDKPFIKKWLGDLYQDLFDYHSRDSWKLADLCKELGLLYPLGSCSLEPLSNFLNIQVNRFHSAYEDALTSLSIYRRCMGILKGKLGIE